MGPGTLLYQGLAMTPEEFWAILYAVPEKVEPVYRLYYNDQGEPLFYSMEDKPGNYIDIDQATFTQASSHVRVKNGRLVFTNTHRTTRKLTPASTGTPCDTRDICVVVDCDRAHTKWTIKTYEST